MSEEQIQGSDDLTTTPVDEAPIEDQSLNPDAAPAQDTWTEPAPAETTPAEAPTDSGPGEPAEVQGDSGTSAPVDENGNPLQEDDAPLAEYGDVSDADDEGYFEGPFGQPLANPSRPFSADNPVANAIIG